MKVVCKLLYLALFALSSDILHVYGSDEPQVNRPCNEGLGYCTPFYKCSNSTVFNDGRDFISVRFTFELETDLCHYLEMCCDPEDIIDVEIVSNSSPDESSITVDPFGESLFGETTETNGINSGFSKTTEKMVTEDYPEVTEDYSPGETTATIGINSGFGKTTEKMVTEDYPEVTEDDSPGETTATIGKHKGIDKTTEKMVTEDYPEVTEDGSFGETTATIGKHSGIDKTTDAETTTISPTRPNRQTIPPIVSFPPKNNITEVNCNLDTHECIPFFYCAKDHTTDGAEKIEARFGATKCSIESQVCCSKQDNLARFKPSVCGMRNKDGLGFSVANNVDEAQFGEFPWMAALTLKSNGAQKYICGGSLIHPHVVLTAAHCVHGKPTEHLSVRLGEWDTKTDKEIFPHTDHDVAQVILHAEFGTANLYNDVALLVLRRACQLSAHINTICLPPQNYKFDDQHCFASGWGAEKYGAVEYRTNLKRVKLPTVPLRDCQDSLRTTRVGPKFRIQTNFMCAGGEKDVDTCTGDGGSPLACKVHEDAEIYYQAGIVSWGIECGQEGIPGVYANVAKFRHWIDQQMNNLGYGTASYSIEK